VNLTTQQESEVPEEKTDEVVVTPVETPPIELEELEMSKEQKVQEHMRSIQSELPE